MKNLVYKVTALLASSSFALCIFSGSSFGLETTEKLSTPFYLPQTNFIFGNSSYVLNLSNSTADDSYTLDASGLNTFGFELEINANRFMNLGAYFRFDSTKVSTNQNITSHFSALLGGFTRFYYIPHFLRGKSFTANVFTRFDLGAGPTVLYGPSGLIAQGGAHIGVETYFNKWFGISFSYGKVYEYGKETFLSGSKEISENLPQYKNATIWNRGDIFMVALKTTFF